VVHRRQRHPLAALARQRIVDHQIERLIGGDPGDREAEQDPAEVIEAPGCPAEEPVEDRDVPTADAPDASATAVIVLRPRQWTQPAITASKVR
jgi:hypothetical protein